jgi:hypothetical protein
MEKLQELYEILSKEHVVLKEILRIEEEKNILLVEGKLADFSEINENLEKLVDRSSKLESERIKITESITDYYKLEKSMPLSGLIPYFPDPEKQKFSEMYQEFKETLTAIKLYSSTNSEMLKNTLEILDITLAHLTEDQEIEYGNVENNTKSHSKSLLLNKLA